MNPTRRHILRAGAASLALPLLDFGTPARADQAAVPTRFVVFTTPQGSLNRGDFDLWTPPTLPGNALDLSSRPILSMLTPLQNKMVLVRGVDNVLTDFYGASGHAGISHTVLTAALTEFAVDAQGNWIPKSQQPVCDWWHRVRGPSIDHYLASKWGAPEPVNLGLVTGFNNIEAYWKVTKDPDGLNSSAPQYNDAVAVFNQFIARPNAAPLTRLDRIKSKRHSVLDAVSTSFNDLYAKVGSADKLRLQQHAQRITEMEAALGNDVALACAVPSQTLPPTYFPLDHYGDTVGYWKYAYANGIWQAQIDNLVQMLSCGARRVMSVNNEDGQGFSDMTFLNADSSVAPANQGLFPLTVKTGGDWHGWIHGPSNTQVLLEGYRYYGRMFKYLLDSMNNIVEPNGKTLLDNSLVLWISEMGNAAAHDTNNLPVVLAGGAQGGLRTGRFIDASVRPGQPIRHSTGDLHTSILKIFGFDEKFGWTGDPSLNHGGIAGLV